MVDRWIQFIHEFLEVVLSQFRSQDFLRGDGSVSRRQKQTKLIKNSTGGNDLGLI